MHVILNAMLTQTELTSVCLYILGSARSPGPRLDSFGFPVSLHVAGRVHLLLPTVLLYGFRIRILTHLRILSNLAPPRFINISPIKIRIDLDLDLDLKLD